MGRWGDGGMGRGLDEFFSVSKQSNLNAEQLKANKLIN